MSKIFKTLLSVLQVSLLLWATPTISWSMEGKPSSSASSAPVPSKIEELRGHLEAVRREIIALIENPGKYDSKTYGFTMHRLQEQERDIVNQITAYKRQNTITQKVVSSLGRVPENFNSGALRVLGDEMLADIHEIYLDAISSHDTNWKLPISTNGQVGGHGPFYFVIRKGNDYEVCWGQIRGETVERGGSVGTYAQLGDSLEQIVTEMNPPNKAQLRHAIAQDVLLALHGHATKGIYHDPKHATAIAGLAAVLLSDIGRVPEAFKYIVDTISSIGATQNITFIQLLGGKKPFYVGAYIKESAGMGGAEALRAIASK